jgi:hypothetical protein
VISRDGRYYQKLELTLSGARRRGSKKRRKGLFSKVSWGMSAFRRLYLLFRGRPQTGEIRLNIDVDVAVPFQHPVWREPQIWGGISGHLSLSSPDRKLYLKSNRKNSISVSRRKEVVYPSRFNSGNALHMICPFISPLHCPSMHHRRYLSEPSTHILAIQPNQYHLFSPQSTAVSRPSILYLAGGALNQQRHKQCFLALTWHPAWPCHCLFANTEIIGCGVRITHETKPDVKLCLHTSSSRFLI